MIFKAIKSISVGVLIQLGLGLAIQGLAQAYCYGSQSCDDSRFREQIRQWEQESYQRQQQIKRQQCQDFGICIH